MAGRDRKYKTQEEINEANRLKRKKYYEKNKETIRKKNLEKYHERKNKNL